MDIEKKSFLLAFSAVIWKRIWASVLLYSEYNNVDVSSDIVLKCLKYNLLSPTGIVDDMKPFLTKALKNGFLMPKEYSDNIYAKKAIQLFGEAYKTCKGENRIDEIDFIHSYASKVLYEDSKNVEENKREKKDLLCALSEKEFCSLVDVWDIEMGLISEKDPYFEIVKYSLLSALT